MFAQLGRHLFQGLKSPNSWGETYAASYGKIPLVNGKDVIQHTGDELAEIELSIRYSIDFCEPATEIEALKRSMRDAEALPFITGEGSIVGKFVITSMDVSNETFSPVGRLEIATVDIKLLEAANAEPSKTKGPALVSANPITQKPAAAIVSPASSITKDISKAQSRINAMKKTAAEAKKGIKSVKSAVKDVRKLATEVQQTYATLTTKVEATKKIIQRAGKLPTSLDAAIKYAENLAKLDNVTDIETLEINITGMSNCANKVTEHAAPIAAFVGSKEGGN
ncbi:MAG: phage tail protein [Dysgonamonadaceae bacterium]|jgi:phage protein U|nr:phage tail protein [Dysgonamonadaceae bacterium]